MKKWHAICATKPAISMKRSSLESQSYTVSVKTRDMPANLVKISRPRVNFNLLFSSFRGANVFHKGHIAHFLSERDEI